MQFDSIQYLFFLPVVVLIFYLVKNQNFRLIFLLLASYFFYACWHPAYLILIILSSIIDYFLSFRLDKEQEARKRKMLVSLSLFANLGILVYFKYFNFILASIANLLQADLASFYIGPHDYLLPVGISFYTFQTIGYTMDVYRKQIPAEKNFIKFALYVSFFPQLVAGPIERAKNILPQLSTYTALNPTFISTGLKFILIGFVKKLVFADNFAPYVDLVYNSPDSYFGFHVLFATLLFSLQIYFDFSGYTDIAIGSAKLFGVDLIENFKGPYFSKSIREFWRRWHISLSNWFRDYLYIPLGGSRVSSISTYRNLLIVFFITGLWHGANWTFIVWGFIHGFFIVLERLGLKNILSKLPAFVSVLYTILVANFAWIFFRAENIGVAQTLIGNATQLKINQLSQLNIFSGTVAVADFYILLVLFILAFISQFLEYSENFMNRINRKGRISKNIIISLLALVLILFGRFTERSEFIYFQF